MTILKTYSALRPLALQNLKTSIVKSRVNDQVLLRFSAQTSVQLQMNLMKSISTTTPLNGGLLKKYEAFMEDNFPRIYSMHRLVVDGTKSCFSELKSFWGIRRDLKNESRNLSDLSMNELAIYIQTREDLVKLLGVAIIASLPLAIPTLALAVIFFPQLVLTRHFWTEDQRKQFWSNMMRKQSKIHFPALTKYIKQANPDVSLDIRTAARVHVPSLEELPFMHLYHLARVHGAFLIFGNRSLKSRAQALQRLDKLMSNNLESMIHLSGTDLHSQLYLRKIYFDDCTTEDNMRESLHEWLLISPYLKDESIYLHLPVFVNSSKNKKIFNISKQGRVMSQESEKPL